MPALSACADLVRRFDPDRFRCALFLPAAVRDDAFALYAFEQEVARIPDLVREPLMGSIRLQWWRDRLDAMAEGRPAEHPVLAALAPPWRAPGSCRGASHRSSRPANPTSIPRARLRISRPWRPMRMRRPEP